MWIWTSSGFSPLMLRTLLTCAVLGYLAVLGAAAPPSQNFKVPWDWRRSRSQNAKAVLFQRQLPWGAREAPMESPSSGWTYPAPPEPEPEPEPVSEVQTMNPRPALTPHMAVLCGESEVHLEVSQDLWGTGSLVDPDELLLGDCSHRQFDSWARVVVFQAGLHTCGSQSEVGTCSRPLVVEP